MGHIFNGIWTPLIGTWIGHTAYNIPSPPIMGGADREWGPSPSIFGGRPHYKGAFPAHIRADPFNGQLGFMG